MSKRIYLTDTELEVLEHLVKKECNNPPNGYYSYRVIGHEHFTKLLKKLEKEEES